MIELCKERVPAEPFQVHDLPTRSTGFPTRRWTCACALAIESFDDRVAALRKLPGCCAPAARWCCPGSTWRSSSIHALASRLALDPREPAHRPRAPLLDVFQLLGDDRVLACLATVTAGHVMASIEEIDRTYFGRSDSNDIRPRDGFAASAAFDSDTDVSHRLRQLEMACRAVFGPTRCRPGDAILPAIRETAELRSAALSSAKTARLCSRI